VKGKEYEERIAEFLKRKGVRILERNYRSRFGEIDILAYYKGRYLVIEVKGSKYKKNSPQERINCKKLKRLFLTWQHYLVKKDLEDTTDVIFLGATVSGKDITFLLIHLEDCPDLKNF
jgi:putative endonuclease